MSVKIPQFAAKEIFYKIVRKCEKVNTSSSFLHRGCCPMCKDYKKRMYLKEYNDHYIVFCHNCSYSHRLESLIKDCNPELLNELKPYILNSIKDGSIFKKSETVHVPKYTHEQINFMLRKYLLNNGFSIDIEQTNKNHEIYRQHTINYLKKRKIPYDIYKEFHCMVKGPLFGYCGIPFYDEGHSKIIHIQGRLILNKDSLRYLFLKDIDNGIEIENKPYWGIWRVNKEEDVFINEGTLDACAIENGIATCGATMSESNIKNIIFTYPKRIWCVDNYWVDKAGRDLTNRLLNLGERCFIIPKTYNAKDLNDLLINYFNNENFIPKEFILKNIYQGKLGLSKLKMLL